MYICIVLLTRNYGVHKIITTQISERFCNSTLLQKLVRLRLPTNRYILVGELIVSKYVAELIKWLINSATYLLTINSPTLKSVAMSLYDDRYILIHK